MSRILRFAAFALLVGALAIGSTTSASASVVEYYTTAAFDGVPASPGTSPATLTAGGAVLTFTGAGSSAPNDQNAVVADPGSPATAFYGTFSLSGVTGLENFGTHSFTLYITQTVPTPASGPTSFTSTLTGKVTVQDGFQGSTLLVTFDNPTTQIVASGVGQDPSSVTYSVPNSLQINPQGQVTTLQGSLTVAPEPSTVALAMAGLPLVGFAAWRRKRRNLA